MKYFTDTELQCPCGCGVSRMDPQFMTRLDALRGVYGMPIAVSSGYRCPEYNACISKTGLTGPHTTGKAVDIAVAGVPMRNLIILSFRFSFKGLGIHQIGPWQKRYIHLDDLEERLWTY